MTRHKTRTGRILVVDDDAAVLAPLSDILSEMGYEVAGYLSPGEALPVLEEKDFDLLITDLLMPEMDGISFMKKAQAKTPLLVCVVVTGHATVRTAVEAMKAGAFDYITKPIEWKNLQLILERAMEVSQLRKSEEKYRAIVEDQTEFICRFLPDGTITYINKAYSRFFSSIPEELIGRNFFQFLSEAVRDCVRKHYSSLIPGNPVAAYELCMTKPDGGISWHRWTGRALFDDLGRLIEFQSVGHDITERVQAELELKESRDQLKALTKRLAEAEEAERRRLARELHDLVGQNLTALGINLNMLHDQLSPVMTKEIGMRLNDALSILAETAKSIRDVMTDLRPSVLDDYGLFAAMRWYSDQFSKRTGTDIVLQGNELVPRLPVEAETTFFRIAQEVLTNVAKHAQAQHITISLQEERGIVQMAITDDGKGFAHTLLKEIPGRKGLGLINIKERAETIGGNVQVTSEPGKGTRVAVEIAR